MKEKYRLNANTNRAIAGAGAILAVGGLATMAWGFSNENSSNAALNDDNTGCHVYHEPVACDALAEDHHEFSAALQLLGNGAVIATAGGATIFLAYKRDTHVSAPADLPFEQELRMFLENKIAPAADVPEEPK